MMKNYLIAFILLFIGTVHSEAQQRKTMDRSKPKVSVKKDGNKSGTNNNVKREIKPKKPVVSKAYLTISSQSANFNSNGGSKIFTISSNKSWNIKVGTVSWGHLSRSGNKLTLSVDVNTGTSSRSDYFILKAGNVEKRIDIYQSGKPYTGPSAQIESITVDHNQTLDDGKGMIIHVKFNVQNMKGKTGRVTAYFYDDNGNALIDTNGRYNTTGSPSYVAVGKNITPSYDNSSYSDLELRMPYSELHQTGSSARTIKFKISIWDKSGSTSKEFYNGTSWTSFTFTPGTEASLTVDGSTSDKTKYFSESGGRERYSVSTSASSYDIWGVPTWCSIEDKTSTGFTLVCSRNTNSSSRSDYMKVKAAGKEIRIDIKQDECSGPTASITSIEQIHNVFNGYSKGMKIKLEFSVSGMKGRSVKATAWFYYGDNSTELKNVYGGQVNVSKSDVAPYENTDFTMTLFLPYQSLNMGRGWNGSLSFDVVISDTSGNKLARKNNSTFTYSQSLW